MHQTANWPPSQPASHGGSTGEQHRRATQAGRQPAQRQSLALMNRWVSPRSPATMKRSSGACFSSSERMNSISATSLQEAAAAWAQWRGSGGSGGGRWRQARNVARSAGRRQTGARQCHSGVSECTQRRQGEDRRARSGLVHFTGTQRGAFSVHATPRRKWPHPVNKTPCLAVTMSRTCRDRANG